MNSDEHLTRLLSRAAGGDRPAMDHAVATVYEDLKDLARRQIFRGQRSPALNTTGLVHEAYMRLIRLDRLDWRGKTHFYALSGRIMRQILIDEARKRQARKRGEDQDHLPLDPERMDVAALPDLQFGGREDELIALDSALEELEALDPRAARVVEHRFFSGMTIEETAAALQISPATVKREWALARAWLHRRLDAGEPTD